MNPGIAPPGAAGERRPSVSTARTSDSNHTAKLVRTRRAKLGGDTDAEYAGFYMDGSFVALKFATPAPDHGAWAIVVDEIRKVLEPLGTSAKSVAPRKGLWLVGIKDTSKANQAIGCGFCLLAFL